MDDHKHLSTYCDVRLHELRRQGEIESLFDFQPLASHPAVLSTGLVIVLVVGLSLLAWWVF